MRERARTDLAVELLNDGADAEGVECSESQVGRIKIRQMKILSKKGEERTGKPMGTYRTLESGRFSRLGRRGEVLLSGLLSIELTEMARRLTGKEIGKDFSVLAVGLGNRDLTADAVGPLVGQRISATRHLKKAEPELFRSLNCASLSFLSPGVLGQTGMESAELVLGAVERIRPDLLLAVDALAARECDHLLAAVQLSDVGIEPGSGVGNHRSAMTKATMGVPVISMGIPTVVNSSVLVREELDRAGEEPAEPSSDADGFFVSPKDCDFLVEKGAEILSLAIREAFTPGL